MAKDTQQRHFGGDWTQEKLGRLAKYLHAYTTIFKGNPHASFFETTYVDAFAGTGTLAAPDLPLAEFLPELLEGVEEYQKGSVRRALEVEPTFDHYIFIEKDKERFLELEKIKSEYPKQDIQVKNEDANEFLEQWCRGFDNRRSRAVVFLDPFGAEVKWKVIRLIARTGGVDLWLLFPLFAVNRMLIRNRKPPGAWASRLTEILGTPDWEKEFYTTKEGEASLFESQRFESIAKVADKQKISNFLVARLKKEFVAVAEPLTLYNSRRSPLYLFCFAAGNKKGATTGLKIAKKILEP
jgi:three-Cys-motif partner protein